MADTPHALISEQDQVITVTLNRPEKLNPVSPQFTSVLELSHRRVGGPAADYRGPAYQGRPR